MKNKLWPNIDGSYLKPNVSGAFTAINQGSKGCNSIKSYVSSQNQIFTLRLFRIEISGLTVGMCETVLINKLQGLVIIDNIIEQGDYKFMDKLQKPTDLSIYSLRLDGNPSRVTELYGAKLEKRWIDKVQLSYLNLQIRSLVLPPFLDV